MNLDRIKSYLSNNEINFYYLIASKNANYYQYQKETSR